MSQFGKDILRSIHNARVVAYLGHMTTEPIGGAIPEITVHHRIRIAREFAGYDQGELAVLTGIARSTISNYESGATTHVKPLYLRQIAMVCGIDPNWLLTNGSRDGLHKSAGSEWVKREPTLMPPLRLIA